MIELEMEWTFMSSTKDGKPPMAMKVRKADTKLSMDPRACRYSSAEFSEASSTHLYKRPHI
jgi:hypothetical protein